jgi:hypothetical protein
MASETMEAAAQAGIIRKEHSQLWHALRDSLMALNGVMPVAQSTGQLSGTEIRTVAEIMARASQLLLRTKPE